MKLKAFGPKIYKGSQVKYDVYCETFSGSHIRQVYADSPSAAVLAIKARCGNYFRCFGIEYSLE